MAQRERLDVALVKRGLARSRAEAQDAISDGVVLVAGRVGSKASTMVRRDEAIVLTAPPRRFVSRGGFKLDAAISASGIQTDGMRCVDVGASTGGFTDRLLQGGAASVVAIDVGYGQFDWSLRQDARVTLFERTNIRGTSVGDLDGPFDLLVADLSFISLRVVMPALAPLIGEGGSFVVLVKPQFEAGKDAVGKGGVVRDPQIWTDCLRSVSTAAGAEGWNPSGVIASPLQGPAGNVEFLIWGTRDAASHGVTDEQIQAAIEAGSALGVAS